MKRSRIALVLFLCTFAACLLAVGFADGGNHSPGRAADGFRDDLDEPADQWASFCHGDDDWTRKATIDRLPAIAPRGNDTRRVQTVVVIVVPSWSACPLIAVGHTLGDTIDVTGGRERSHEAVNDDGANEPAAFDCLSGEWAAPDRAHDCTSLVADQRHSIGNDEALSLNRTQDGLSSIRSRHRNGGARHDVDPLVAVVRGTGGPWPAWLVAQHLRWSANRVEHVWEGCDGFPDAAVGAWLDSSAQAATVQTWRSLASVARDLAGRFERTRQAAIAEATRQVVDWLSRYASGGHSHASRGPSLSAPPAASDTSRATGLLITL